MDAARRDRWCFDLAALLARVLLGAYMFIAGLDKVRGGVTAFVQGAYAKTTPPWLPSAIAVPYGYALPFLELAGGALLVLGLFTRSAAVVVAAMLASIAIAVKFGANEKPPFHHSVIFMALALLLAATGPGRYALDAFWRKRRADPGASSPSPSGRGRG